MLDVALQVIALLLGAYVLLFFTQLAGHLIRRRRTPQPGPVVEEHFGQPIRNLPLVSMACAPFELPNLHAAIEELRASAWRNVLVMGVHGGDFNGLSLRSLGSSGSLFSPFGGYEIGPVEHRPLDVGTDKPLRCIRNGLLLFDAGVKAAVLLVATDRLSPTITLEVMAPTDDDAHRILEQIKRTALARNVYRNKAVSLVCGRDCGATGIQFHDIPAVTRNQLILPEHTVLSWWRGSGFSNDLEAEHANEIPASAIVYSGTTTGHLPSVVVTLVPVTWSRRRKASCQGTDPGEREVVAGPRRR